MLKISFKDKITIKLQQNYSKMTVNYPISIEFTCSSITNLMILYIRIKILIS